MGMLGLNELMQKNICFLDINEIMFNLISKSGNGIQKRILSDFVVLHRL
jgi:hypothetical protein